MPLRDGIDEPTWRTLVDEVDWRLTSAIERVCTSAPSARTMVAIAEGFNELQTGLRMHGAHEPDYRKLGVVIAYTFKFMPQRVSSVVAALALMARHGCNVPRRVLDVGSGTDATRVAFDLALQAPDRAVDGGRAIQFVTIEPSYAMQSFGKTIGSGPGLAAEHVKRYVGGLDYRSCVFDCADGFDSERDFDCIVLSACLPYNLPTSAMYWNTLSRSLIERAAPECVIVIIEPQAKRDLLVRLSKSFTDAGHCQSRVFPRLGPRPQQDPCGLGTIVEPRTLEFLTNLLRRLGGELRASGRLQAGAAMFEPMARWGIESWNPNRDECISLLFVNKPQTAPDSTERRWFHFLRGLRAG
jgi:hypothetical protein